MATELSYVTLQGHLVLEVTLRWGGRETGANLLVLCHLVQHDLGHGLLLHLHGDAVGGIVVLHIHQLSLVGRHSHHPLAPADSGGGIGGGGREG